MNTLKLTLCVAVTAFGLLSATANAEGWGPRYTGYHPQYSGMLSLKQKMDLKNYQHNERREPCQNYKALPADFYQDGCSLLYKYPRIENASSTSVKRIVLASYTIEFAFDSAAIESGAEPVLSQIANEINKFHPRDVTVSGYTDSHGTADYNVDLSQRRANSVSEVLTGRGVPNRTIDNQAYGETNQAVATQDGVALRANRRVIVEFLK